MKYTLFLLQLIVLQACAASTTCEDSGSQIEMTSCAQKNLASLERKLKVKHETLSEYLEGNHLEQAITAWEGYRDAHCTSTSSIYSGGSIHAYVLAECKAKVTDRRLDSLDEDYQDALDIIRQGSP